MAPGAGGLHSNHTEPSICTLSTALLVPSPSEIKQISKITQHTGPGLGGPGQSTFGAQSEKPESHRNSELTALVEATQRPNPSSHSSAPAPGCHRHTDSKARTEQASSSRSRKYSPSLAEGTGCPFNSQRTLMKMNALIHTHIHHQS